MAATTGGNSAAAVTALAPPASPNTLYIPVETARLALNSVAPPAPDRTALAAAPAGPTPPGPGAAVLVPPWWRWVRVRVWRMLRHRKATPPAVGEHARWQRVLTRSSNLPIGMVGVNRWGGGIDQARLRHVSMHGAYRLLCLVTLGISYFSKHILIKTKVLVLNVHPRATHT